MNESERSRAEELIGLLHHPAFSRHLDSHYLTYKDVLLLLEYQWDQFVEGESSHGD